MVATFAVVVIVSRAMLTVTVQRGSVLPLAQLLPAVAEVTVLVRRRSASPVMELLTMTV